MLELFLEFAGFLLVDGDLVELETAAKLRDSRHELFVDPNFVALVVAN